MNTASHTLQLPSHPIPSSDTQPILTPKPGRKVFILHTGGTIGMVPTAHGYAPQAGEIEKILLSLRQEYGASLPEYEWIEYNPLLDSTDLSCSDWIRMGQDIAKREAQYDGFLILHGTDTMAYTASALSFMLQGLNKPVILTGSQIPLCRLRSDGRDNLIDALLLAAYSEIPEVCLYFGGQLFRGNRATKISAERFDAFASPNAQILAESGIDIRLYPKRWRSAGPGITLQPFTPKRIGVLKIFPGIQFSLFENLPDQGLDGLILEAFGAGNIPFGEGGLKTLLETCSARNIPTVVLTQCLQGRARLGEYAASSPLCKLGAISGADLTVEAAVTKLTYLLSQENPQELHQQMSQDLCGELTPEANPTPCHTQS